QGPETLAGQAGQEQPNRGLDRGLRTPPQPSQPDRYAADGCRSTGGDLDLLLREHAPALCRPRDLNARKRRSGRPGCIAVAVPSEIAVGASAQLSGGG